MSPGQSRLLLVLATLLVALVGAVVWLEPPEETEPGMPSWTDAFPDVTAADIQRLRLTGAGRTVEVEREGGGWRLLQPVVGPADDQRAQAAAQALATVELAEPFDRTDAAVYGLAPAARVVEATTTAGQTLRLELGDDSPAGAGTYARDAQGRLRVTRTRLSASLPLDPAAWRDRGVVRLAQTAAVAVEVRPEAGAAWSLRQTEGRWWLSRGDRLDPASERTVSELLEALNGLEASAFAEAPLADVGGAVVEVTEADGTAHRLTIGPGDGPTRWVTGPLLDEPAEADVGRVLAALSGAATPSPVLLPFDPGRVDALTVTLGETRVSADRTAEGWSPPAGEAALAALLAARVVRAGAVPAPEGAPWGRVEVVQGDAVRAVALHQPHADGRVAVDEAGGAPFVVRAADLDRLAAALAP